MAHLFITQPSFRFLPVFFNVDTVVGDSPAVNNFEDVLLVKFFFNVIAKQTRDPKLLSATRLVGFPDGVMDGLTIKAIVAVQEIVQKTNPGQVVDGRVSPAKGGAISYGGGLWTIAVLNNFIKDKNINVWPRIDLIRGFEFPFLLQSMLNRTLNGIPSTPDPFASQ
jgi:hypothetical protein